MILLEREPLLAAELVPVRAQIVLALQAHHAIFEFDGPEDLRAHIIEVCRELKALGHPPRLSRVILFTTRMDVMTLVNEAMHPTMKARVFPAPGCWVELAKLKDDLSAMARRVEPEWAQRVGL